MSLHSMRFCYSELELVHKCSRWGWIDVESSWLALHLHRVLRSSSLLATNAVMQRGKRCLVQADLVDWCVFLIIRREVGSCWAGIEWLAPIPSLGRHYTSRLGFSRMFWRIWLLHRDVHECRDSDEQNESSECDQGNWQRVQHVCFVRYRSGVLDEER